MKPAPDTNEAGRSLKEVARENANYVWELDLSKRSIEAYGVACMKLALERAKDGALQTESLPHYNDFDRGFAEGQARALKHLHKEIEALK